jgi:mycothiol conjugate amidase Mca
VAELRLLAVHAHGDDETITMGGTLAVLGDRGVKTSVLCCTDGKLATIVDPDMPEETTRPRLAEIRQQELRDACRILGVAEVNFLGYGDSGMAGEATNQLPDAFWMAPINESVGKLVEHIRRFRPHVVVTYDGNGGYGHPDHIQTHRVTMLGVEAASLLAMYPEAGKPWRVQKVYYTVFPRSYFQRMIDVSKQLGVEPPFGVDAAEALPFLTPDQWVSTKVDCSAGLDRKREALRAHRSQIAPDWPLLNVPDEIARQFADEYYELVISRAPSSEPDADLFAGVQVEEPAAVS